MPPWENTSLKIKICLVCNDTFTAKRDSAKYCSDRCREKNRPARPPENKDKQKERRKRRYEDPEYRARENAKSYARLKKVKKWINEYKLAHGCIDCGYNKHPMALDFDHTNGKTASIATLKSIQSVIAEIVRHDCVVRCANCHRVKSFETKSWLGHSASS